MTTTVVWALALAAASVVASAVVRNRIIRRRLRFTLVALGALVVLHAAAHHTPPLVAFSKEEAVERLLLALALINAAVALAFNPWLQDRVFDRSPAIVQDTLVVAVSASCAVYLFKDTTFLTASAIAAAAVGFALQDTLANAFAGLAIQIEKPFRVGHWVSAAGHEGAVAEVTWRATKIRTKLGNLVVIPNSLIAKEAINNFSEPVAPTRAVVEVGAAYGVPPNEVRDAIVVAMRQVPDVLASPAAEALMEDFGASALVYRARFWIADFSRLEYVQDAVRRAIYYEFRRRRIEIPWPIRVSYTRHEAPSDGADRRESFAQSLAATPVLGGLEPDALRSLAAAADERIYGDGEVIVCEGDPGESMFLVRSGRAAVTIGRDKREVARIDAGGYFGEMSLLTGEPRTATVRATGDCVVLEIRANAFAAYIRSHPEAVERLAATAAERRRELDASRAEQTGVPIEMVSLAQRIRRFFGIVPAGRA